MKTINLYDNLQIILKIINIGFGRWLSVVFLNLGVATPLGLNNPFIELISDILHIRYFHYNQ